MISPYPRNFSFTLASCLLIWIFTLISSQADISKKKPNVIFIVADDSCFGDLSCYGNRFFQTPNLDRLHGESIRLDDFHVAPMCTPSRAQFMTGLHAMRTGAFLVGTQRNQLRADLPIMPEIFRDGGYRTGIFGKWHLGDNYPLRPQDRGFEEVLWFPQAAIGEKIGTYWGDDYINSHFEHNGLLKQFSGYSTDVFFNEAILWMESCAKEKAPFFCYLPLNIPHGPYFAPEEEREKQSPEIQKLGKELRTHVAMITNFDKNMGRLEQWLRSSGQWENTILIYTVDNGGAHGVQLNDHGERGWKSKLTEGGHHVPFFLRWPAGGLRAPVDITGLTDGTDLLPTLLALTNLKSQARFDGIDLSPVLRDPAQALPDRTLIVQCQRAGPVTQEDSCVMKGPWRLIGKKELYNLATDRHQDKNIIAEQPGVAAELQEAFDSFWSDVSPLQDNNGIVIVGSEAENPLTLTPSTWAKTYMVDNENVRRGSNKNDFWNVIVQRDGDYELSLRRWPSELNLPLTAPCPPSQYNDVYCYGPETAPGVALPIAEARIQVGSHKASQKISNDDQAAVTFKLKLAAGPVRMQTWFYDKEGKSLGGAYYLTIERK
jgi:arylsulfatase A-like enzyme